VSQSTLAIANGTGSSVRAAINTALQAQASNQSGSSAPSTTYAFQFFADSNTDTLFIRNEANNAYVNVCPTGQIGAQYLGLAPIAAPTFTGEVVFNTTGSFQTPSGTTAQRPGSPTNGDFRYSTTLNAFEGYVNGAWSGIGGGAAGGGSDQLFYETDQAATTSYSITAGHNAMTVGFTVNAGVTITIPSGSTLVVL
jgi:hypothetical protein